jgi:hypothetical protein
MGLVSAQDPILLLFNLAHRIMTKILFACLIGIVALAPRAHGDIIIQGYTNATNDRFTNSPSFIANGFNLSGIGQTVGGIWGTLISPNVIVSANHFRPSGTITFYPNNDPNSTPVHRQVTTNTLRINGSDIWLGQLDLPVDASITPFSYSTTTLNGPSNAGIGPNDPIVQASAGIYQGLDAYVVGNSPANVAATRDQAIGRNVISFYAEDVPANGITDSLIFEINNSHPFEATLVGGDSGAPFFVDINNQFVLLGVNSYNLEDNNMVVTAGAVAYLGNYSTEIQDFINASAVPEPSSLLCTSMMLLGIAIRVRHRKPSKLLAIRNKA